MVRAGLLLDRVSAGIAEGRAKQHIVPALRMNQVVRPDMLLMSASATLEHQDHVPWRSEQFISPKTVAHTA